MSTITKALFLNTISCPTLGWLINSEHVTVSESIAQKFRMEEGVELHKRARNLFARGHLVDGNVISAAEKTKKLLKDKDTSVIFEATFLVGDYVTKADILKREQSGWCVFEVKSSVNDKVEFIDDMAYTVMVGKQAGLQIAGCSLILVSRDYRLGMNDDKLFVGIDHTDEVLKRAREFSPYCEDILRTISQDKRPDAELKWECRSCGIFKKCLGQGIENHVFDLPRLSQKKFCDLTDLGILNVEDISDDFPLTPNQCKIKDAVNSGQPVINKQGLKDALESILFPAYYLDFETIQTAIPLYPDIAPYTQIPTQYSLHRCSYPGQVEEHFEYLSDPKIDSRKKLAEKLINDCGRQGSIIIYTSFDKSVINGLIKLFPDFTSNLEALVRRLVDLSAIISKNFCHPEFHGSFSIKRVLPVLVPELSYETIDISDGSEAMATFAYLAKGRYDEQEAEQAKKNLLEYCKLDTFAMVKLHKHLMEYV